MGKTRPVVVVSNDLNNLHSATVTVVPLTSKRAAKVYPFEVSMNGIFGLPKESKAKADQVRTLDRRRLRKRLGRLPVASMKNMARALRLHLHI